MPRKTVVQLLPALQAGGVERSTLEIAQALVQAGHRAVVVSAGGRLVAPLLASGAEHITMDIGRKSLLTLRHVRSLRRLFAELSADVVHARSRLPAWIGLLALRGMPGAMRPHWVTTVHGLNSPGRYSRVMTSGERVICVSATVRDYVRRHYPGLELEQLRVVPRGIDVAQFPRRPGRDVQARAWAQNLAPRLRADERLLLLPGRGTRLKGHLDGMRLLASLLAQGFSVRLWLLGVVQPGREDYLRELHAEAERLGIADAVTFSEPTSRVADAYAASDLVLQLSRKPEAFGRTVVEALAVGRPVLGWSHGGVGELLAELQPAGAVAPFDDGELARRAAALLTAPPPLPLAIPYTLQAMQQATLAIYDELAD